MIVAGTGWASAPAVLTWDVGGSDEEFQIREVGEDGVFSMRIDPRQRAQGSRIRVRVTQTFPLQVGIRRERPATGPAPDGKRAAPSGASVLPGAVSPDGVAGNDPRT